MSETIRLGTRGSELATTQTGRVRELLLEAHPDLRVEVVTIRSRGDADPTRDPASVSGPGFFTRALDRRLAAGDVDLVVHSLKDVPMLDRPPGIRDAAVPERAPPEDVLCGSSLADLPSGGRVGTGSPRRRAFLRALRDDLSVVPIRGNVPTRLGKLDGDLDAVCLARAGLERIGRTDAIAEVLDPDAVPPAPGQGALLVVGRPDDPATARARALDHEASRRATEAERAFLRRLGGGCHFPAGALGRIVEGRVVLQGGVADPRRPAVVVDREEGPSTEATSVGERLAERVLEAGGREILDRLDSP